MFTKDELLNAYYKEYGGTLVMYCHDCEVASNEYLTSLGIHNSDTAIDYVLSELNFTPDDDDADIHKSMAAAMPGLYPDRTLDHGVKMLYQILRAVSLTYFVSLLTLDEIMSLLKILKKTTCWEVVDVIALSKHCRFRLRDIADEWNRQHDGESNKQIYLEPSHSW